MAIHTGKEPAELAEHMNPNDTDVFWLSWSGKLNGETIVTSSWILPGGFTLVASSVNGSVTENGKTYTSANSATISTISESGKYSIYNEITTSGGRTIRRGFFVIVGDV